MLLFLLCCAFTPQDILHLKTTAHKSEHIDITHTHKHLEMSVFACTHFRAAQTHRSAAWRVVLCHGNQININIKCVRVRAISTGCAAPCRFLPSSVSSLAGPQAGANNERNLLFHQNARKIALGTNGHKGAFVHFIST